MGQVEGGTTMGYGYALMEELITKDGLTVNNSLASYLIPTSKDVPPINVRLLEYLEPYAPYRARGMASRP